jgi:hypothetical protein
MIGDRYFDNTFIMFIKMKAVILESKIVIQRREQNSMNIGNSLRRVKIAN